jgi:hypothetical protein
MTILFSYIFKYPSKNELEFIIKNAKFQLNLLGVHTFKLKMSVFSDAVITSGSLAPIALHLALALSQLYLSGSISPQLHVPSDFW